MTGFCPFSPEDRVAYAYGELPAERQQAFADHLADCRTCALEVAELEEAAALCATLRGAELPEPRFTQDQAPAPRRPFWRRPFLFWTPVAAAAAAAVLLFILLSPAPKVPAPTPPVPDRSAAAALPVQIAETTGATMLRPADGGEQVAFSGDTILHPGDVLDTGEKASVRIELEDGSQLQLSSGSQLALTSVGQAGDRFSLDRGSLHCRVTPRDAGRPFLVSAPEATVRVVGTRFTVTRKAGLGVEVRVQEGVVAVTPTRDGAEPTLLRAREKGLVSPDGSVERSAQAASDEPDEEKAPTQPVKVAKVQPRAEPTKRPEPPLPAKPPVAKPSKPEYPEAARPASHAPESLEALVARLHEDTAWIFDQFRTDMKAGRYADVLRKLDNYLSDPDSPRRDEATFLKAVCLEKLDRRSEALRTYRAYLERWPTGKRAADCRASIRRIWASK